MSESSRKAHGSRNGSYQPSEPSNQQSGSPGRSSRASNDGSPSTRQQSSSLNVKLGNGRFKDAEGRTVTLRGINLGSNMKMPTRPNGFTSNRNHKDFFNHRDVSFVGRPFPLNEADRHFTRLRRMGFTLLRFLITWEAIEHSGPGIYDTEYLDYLYEVVQLAGKYGFLVWIDPHQDAWSRFTGGSGAPGWTLSAAGMDMQKFKACGAAIVHQTHGVDGAPFPRMIWPTNYTKFACATMFSIFFAGKDLAPQTQVDGVNIQEYLQSHYFKAIRQVVKKLKPLACVMGYGAMNEPNMGWIGLQDLEAYKWPLLLGECPTPFQSMCLAGGIPQLVNCHDFWMDGKLGFRKVGTQLVNPQGVSIMKDGKRSIWEQNGVWARTAAGPQLLKKNHFSHVNGKMINFYSNYFVPFCTKYANEIHKEDPSKWIFVEDAPFSPPGAPHLRWPKRSVEDKAIEKIVCADHWYDGVTLMMKTWKSWMAWDGERIQIGDGNAQAARNKGIEDIQTRARKNMGNVPWLVGEVGIPFDLNEGMAFRTKDWSAQIAAADASMKALESVNASFTWWNYTSDNCNRYGDNWNGEDFSIYSRDNKKGTNDILDGGRALEAIIRPHVRRCAGHVLHQQFDIQSKVYNLVFRHDKSATGPTIIFVPDFQYTKYAVSLSDGSVTKDSDRQIMYYTHTNEKYEHEITIYNPVVKDITTDPSFMSSMKVRMMAPVQAFRSHNNPPTSVVKHVKPSSQHGSKPTMDRKPSSASGNRSSGGQRKNSGGSSSSLDRQQAGDNIRVAPVPVPIPGGIRAPSNSLNDKNGSSIPGPRSGYSGSSQQSSPAPSQASTTRSHGSIAADYSPSGTDDGGSNPSTPGSEIRHSGTYFLQCDEAGTVLGSDELFKEV